jgi:hypothetical protein
MFYKKSWFGWYRQVLAVTDSLEFAPPEALTLQHHY